MSIILSLAGDGTSSDLLTRSGYRQVIRISGKGVIKIFGTRTRRLSLGQTVPDCAARVP